MNRTRLLALVGFLAALGCSDERLTDPITPLGLELTLTPKADTLFLGDLTPTGTTVTMSVVATVRDNVIPTPPGRVFSTSDATVATVDSVTGQVVAAGLGTAQIGVRVNDVKAFSTIVVLPVVKTVQVTASAPQALVGDTIVVTAKMLGWQGQTLTGQPVAFSSSSSSATVSPNGRVVFTAPGTATITARSGVAVGSVALTALAREFVGGGVGSIASGNDATCGLLPLGKTFCFGKAPVIGIAKDTTCFDNAQPGGTTSCSLVPLQIAGQLQLTTVVAGDNVACGLNAQNQAYCWGDNSFGQIGDGVAAPGTSELPHLVTGPLNAIATFTQIAAGRSHVCALSSSGAAYCWGADTSFQLGNSDSLRINSSTPIPVRGGFTYTGIAAGRGHTCAIRTGDGIAVCWGDNARGQLGRGTFGDSSDVPTPVSSSVAFTQLSAKGDFTCGRTTSGQIYCWGDNQFGQTTESAVTLSTTPVLIPGNGFASVTVGWTHACALSTSGTASCWGDNSYSQLGNGGASSRTPVQVTGTYTAISAGSRTTCAVAADGAYCWGSAIFGATGGQVQAIKVSAPTKTAPPQ